MGQKGEKVIIATIINYNNTNKVISTYKSDAQCNCSPPTNQFPAISQAAALLVYSLSMMVYSVWNITLVSWD